MKALVTGASSGIGRDMARYLGSKHYDLIITARRTNRLLELKKEIEEKYGVNVRVITCDVADEKQCRGLYEQTKNDGVDMLINNAGFGIHGKFSEIDLDRELNLIDTNIRAVHILTKLFLKDFVKKDSGCILNVASSAGFLAGPLLSSYYASKNYVVRLTQGIYEELRREKSNVKISALCPGPVKTEFDKVANVKFAMDGVSSEYVAKYAIDRALKGKMIIIPGMLMKLSKFCERFISEKAVTKISYNIQKRKN